MSIGAVSSSSISDVQEQVPFPGVKAHFVVKSRWHIFEGTRSGPIRALTYVTETKGSFFTEVEIIGYRNGAIAFNVSTDPLRREIAETYFKQIGFEEDVSVFVDQLIVNTHEKMEKLFSIVIQNNIFKEKEIDLAQRLIEAGEWRSVTPLTAGEKWPGIAPEDGWLF